DVHLVAGGGGALEIRIDNEKVEGDDILNSALFTDRFDLYNIIRGAGYNSHLLEIKAENSGFKVYSLSFG
ncbi:hypothetical protein ACFL0V_06440, partial [Nanoarchaeota archaeon]